MTDTVENLTLDLLEWVGSAATYLSGNNGGVANIMP
jgi:hypothetical protein